MKWINGFAFMGGSAQASFTPAAAAHAAGDVMGGAQAFADIGLPGAEVLITGTVFETDHTALVGSEAGYTLHLYSQTPPSALADDAAWDLPTGDRAYYLGKIALGTPVDLGSTLWVEQANVNKQITVPASGTIYAYLVTDAGITPTAAARKVTLKTVVL